MAGKLLGKAGSALLGARSLSGQRTNAGAVPVSNPPTGYGSAWNTVPTAPNPTPGTTGYGSGMGTPQAPSTYTPAPDSPNAPAAPAQPAPVAPFWTPAQQAAWIAYNTKYNTGITNLNDRLNTGIHNHDTNLAIDQAALVKNTSLQNQVAAARGVFQSGINLTALADLNTHFTIQKNALDTTLANLRITIGGDISDLNTAYTAAQTAYNQEGVTNAQGVTPTVAPASNPTNQSGPPPAASAPTRPASSGAGNAGSAVANGASHLSNPNNNGGGSLAAGLGQIGSAVAKGAGNLAKPPGTPNTGNTPKPPGGAPGAAFGTPFAQLEK